MAENELLTTGAIAAKLGRSRDQVQRAVRSLRLDPAARAGTYRLYAPEHVSQVAEKLGAVATEDRGGVKSPG